MIQINATPVYRNRYYYSMIWINTPLIAYLGVVKLLSWFTAHIGACNKAYSKFRRPDCVLCTIIVRPPSDSGFSLVFHRSGSSVVPRVRARSRPGPQCGCVVACVHAAPERDPAIHRASNGRCVSAGGTYTPAFIHTLLPPFQHVTIS